MNCTNVELPYLL